MIRAQENRFERENSNEGQQPTNLSNDSFMPLSVLHLPLGVAEDDRLRYGEGIVQIAQRVELPLLLLHRNEELSVSLI